MPESRIEAADVVIDARKIGIELDLRRAERLLEFRDQLLRWNRAFNLVSRRDTGRLLERHLLDSLSIAPQLLGNRVMDLGTGAGLPGVPLGIAREEMAFLLVDRNQRKIRFINQVIRSLGLTNVSGWCGDVRALEPEAVFDTVVCRAVAGVAELWALAGDRVARGGRMVIMHRGQSSAEALPQAALPVEARRQTHRVSLPGLTHSHEVVVVDRTNEQG